jgi:hypothetical protein
MPHLILLGDSIFDNATYVPGEPAVIDQVRALLPAGSTATLLAVDGNVTIDVARQMARLPNDATHLFVSVGGNDALAASGKLYERTTTVAQGLEVLHEIGRSFRRHYQAMLAEVLSAGKHTALCTIYDAIPPLGRSERTALSLFNDIIGREAFAAGLPLIDLRLVCSEERDYSPLSPIEPSARGGEKIAQAIAQVASEHDFSRKRSSVYLGEERAV